MPSIEAMNEADGVSTATRRVRVKRPKRRISKRTMWLIGAPALVLVVGLLVLVYRAKRPEGQVIARVGGSEVTVQDVLAEARAEDRPSGEILTPDLVEAVIARSLLAKEARRRGLQHSPSFPSDERRSASQFLANTLLRSLPTPPPATAEQVAAFIAAHPERFEERRRLILDELRYRSAGAPDLQGMRFDEARRRLDAGQSHYDAHQVTTIAADLPPPLQHALDVADKDTVVVWRGGPICTAFHVAAAEPAPLLGEAAQFSALETLNQTARERQVMALIRQLKGRDAVTIQPGYGP